MSTLLFKTKLGKYLKVRLCLPAQEAMPGQMISVALGQHGIKTNEFIKQFNASTVCFPKGVKISILVEIFQDGSFKFSIKGVEILSLLKEFINETNKSIFFKDLFLIALLLKKNRSFFVDLPIKSILKNLMGTLKSRKIKILI